MAFLILVGCVQVHARTVELFNFGWMFQRGSPEHALQIDLKDILCGLFLDWQKSLSGL